MWGAFCSIRLSINRTFASKGQHVPASFTPEATREKRLPLLRDLASNRERRQSSQKCSNRAVSFSSARNAICCQFTISVFSAAADDSRQDSPAAVVVLVCLGPTDDSVLSDAVAAQAESAATAWA